MTLITLLSFNLGILANVNEDIWSLSEQSKAIVRSIDKRQMLEIKDSANNKSKDFLQYVQQLKRQSVPAHGQGGKVANGAILFVSFSMPPALLEELIDDAESYKIPVVIKGLVNGDFTKTIEAIGKLKIDMKKNSKNFSGVQIDPIWFDVFHINRVPALVVTKRNENCFAQGDCPNQKYDVVYGNISIKKGLEILSERGEVAKDIAQKILGGAYG